jgi:hypothetical protein
MKTIDIKWKDQVYTAIVDDGAHELIARHTWYIMFSGVNKKPYAFAELYSMKDGERIKRMFYMHQFVAGSFTQIDHVNGNSLDNRFENLRPATYQENGWNKPKNMNRRKDGRIPKSQYKGVRPAPTKQHPIRWQAYFKFVEPGKHKSTGKMVYLGYYDTEVEAAKAYNEAIVKYRGEFAWINPLPEINQANATKG